MATKEGKHVAALQKQRGVDLPLAVISVVCAFNGSKAPFDFYIGEPEAGHHPVHFQNKWLSDTKGGIAPSEWLTSLQELRDISIRNGVDFKDLVMYVMSASVEAGKGAIEQ